MSRSCSLVMVSAQELGGARAILPVLQQLGRLPGIRLRIVAQGPAVKLFEQERIPAEPLARFGRPLPLSEAVAASVVRSVGPDLLLAPLSHPRDPSSGRLIQAARVIGIPTIGLLDQWKGWNRFREVPNGPTVFAPDVLGVMDRRTQAVFIRQGWTADQVPVVGHPYLERLHERRSWLNDREQRAQLRRRAGLEPEARVVLFCSEIVHDHGYHDPCGAGCRPLGEMPVSGGPLLETVREAVESLKTDAPHHLILRSHPNEPKSLSGFRTLSEGILSDEEAVAQADVVLGLSAMPLIEAAILGRPAASLAYFDGWHPGRAFVDETAWDTQPFFRVLARAEELSGFLDVALSGGGGRRLPPAYEQEVLIGATERCLGLIMAELGISQALPAG